MKNKEKNKSAVVHYADALGSPGIHVPRDVEVQTKLEVAHSEMVKKLGSEIIEAHGAVAGKYLQICLYIREHKVAPKLVSFELTRLGFKRSRISEVNRVSQASDKLFSDFQARLIGFEKCIDLARVEVAGEKAKETPAAKLLIGQGELTPEDVEESTEKPYVGPTGKAKSGPEKMLAAAKVIASNATRNREWVIGRWKITLEKQAVTAPAVGD